MKLLLTAFALLVALTASSQVFWTEAFENSCSSDCLAAGVNTGNGPWTVTSTGANGDMNNLWYISCAENGQAAGQCGAGCGSDESLHLSSQTIGDLGAAYDAGGLCGFFWCTNTDQRVESPTINCTGFSNITIAFNYIEGGQTTLDDATLWWFNGTVWAQLTNMAKTTTAGCAGQGLWAAFSMVLPAGADNNPNVKIGFRWVNNDDGVGTDPSFAVDDITLSVVSTGNTVTTGTITGSPFCACATVSVPFTSTGTFTAGNVYTAQLSDASGSFAAPVSIGTLNSTANSGTISATIPCNTPTGTGYRIRVIASAPSTTGTDNGVNITVNAPPVAPTASVTVQPTCSVPTGTILVTAPSGANIQYSIGGAYQASGTFSGVAPGTYNVTAQNTTTGCTSTATSVTVNAVPTAPAAPTTSVTIQPTCSVPTGTITVTAPSGANIQYSIGGAYQTSGTFTGVTPGTYNVTAQNTTTGCTSTATSVTVNAVPTAPAAPTASVTSQPSCSVPTGTITVTAPSGASILYSVGGAYQASGIFSGLPANSYNVTAQDNVTGCTSTATVLIVNAPPGAPATPTASVTQQPTCSVPTGTITVTAPSGATIEYSIGGAYQASGTFSGLAPGSYTITAQDNVSGCTSTATVLVVNVPPGAPAAPTASVTQQPTCAVPTGTIVVTAPSGATIEYSIGGAYQASGTFSGLAPGSYTITAQDNVSGCTSTATVLVVNAIPGAPAAPTASVTQQPTCSVPTGTIVVTAPSGATIEYSIGGAYQASGAFSGLAPGSYTITAQDNVSGCTSTATVLVVNAIPGAPAAPTASITQQPTCSVPTGTIVVTAPTGAAIEYSIGGAYQTSGTFSGLVPGSYTITAQDNVSGCTSTATVVVVNTVAGAPVISVDDVTDVSCPGENDGSATISATGGTSPYTYSWSPSGGSAVTASNLTAGSYNVTVTDNTGCSSIETIVIGSPAAISISGTETNINCTTGTAGSISTSITGGISPYTYSWSPNGETTSGLNGLEVGNYTLTITDDNGCTANELFAIGLSGSLTVNVTPANAEIDAGESVPLIASGGTDYIWTPGAGLSCTTCSNPTATPSTTTTYTVSATDDLGCTGTASTTIIVNYECGSLFVPNAFSPNDNGPAVNNKLCVLGASECIVTMSFEIYSRWGEKVFESTNIDTCWDGTYKEEQMNSGVYVYKLIATLIDGTVIEQSGNTVLTR
jgi:gliding motility-associated-like protein